MNMKAIYPLFLMLIAINAISAEIDDDQPPAEVDLEGSGAGILEAPDVTIVEQEPILDSINTPEVIMETPHNMCPEACTCSVAGGENFSYTVDCSDQELITLPSEGFDEKTTILYLQNNQLSTIPKTISQLKNLVVLNLNNNSLTNLEPGSISELPNLTTLKLSNNKLLEFPQELKNGFGLTRLEDVDLSGNDIKDNIKAENFENFKSLRRLTLPKSEAISFEELCSVLKDNLETVCLGSCNDWHKDCSDLPHKIDTDFIKPALPETTTSKISSEGDSYPNGPNDETTTQTQNNYNDPQNLETTTAIANVSLQKAAVIPISADRNIVELTAIANSGEIPQEGAATANSYNGGVNKSVIGIIVAGMVLVVAGITIQKNWSSIKTKFGSQQRPVQAEDRNGHGGSVPEEEPLQNKNKSPV